ncbi:MAG: hypothetical protein HOL99_12725 [Halieaceae bacterium]|nr:hypothetical protein [Halieaceae bacterium]
MASFLDKLQDNIRGSVSFTDSLVKLFPSLDKKRLREDINIEERARANGQDNLPPSDATQLDSVESEIVASANTALVKYSDDYENQYQAYWERVESLKSLMRDFATISEFQRTLSNIQSEIKTQKDQLYEKEERVRGLVTEIRHWRVDNGLMRQTPVISSGLSTAAKLLLAALVEVGLTSVLMRDAGNLVTVFGISALFIVLNVVLVFLLPAHYAKYVHKRKNSQPDRVMRCWGWAVVVAYLVYAVVLNLGFSHLRTASASVEELLATNPDAFLRVFQLVGEHALSELWLHWFALPDLYSYFLFVLGLCVSLYAFREGFLFNGSYPSYGSFAKRYQEAFHDYADMAQSTVEHFQEERDQGMTETKTAIEELRAGSKQVPMILSNAQALEQRFGQAVDALNLDLKVLIQEYRQENRRARTDAAPAYFDETPQLDMPSVQPFPAIEVVEPAKTIEVINQYRDDVYELYNEAINKITNLRELFKSKHPFQVEES